MISTAATTPTSAAPCTRSAARRPKPTKARAASWPRSSTCARDELVLCSGTTFAINLVAYSWALPRLQPGDAILLTRMEHHANIVPWQLVAERTGATIKVAELDARRRARSRRAVRRDDAGGEAARRSPTSRNVLGTVNPVREICREARKRGIVTVVDGSQARAAPRRSTSRRSAAISTPSPATRCAARPAPARCGRGASTWRRCRRSSAAAR